MWTLFVVFIGVSVFNNFRHAAHASGVLANHTEVSVDIVEVIPILVDGDYNEFSVEFEYDIVDSRSTKLFDVPKDVYYETYDGVESISMIYSNDDTNEINLRSYYERRADMLDNWGSLLFGYLVVFLLLFLGRHYLLKLVCGRTGE